jgi:cysteine desulfurase/selenocysteine lyase
MKISDMAEVETLVSALDIARIRADFPILEQRARGKPLVYFDNAATTQKPQVVIDALDHYYRNQNANIHRGVHWLSQLATEAYENSRATIQRFINACESREVIFVRGATEGINLVAQSYGRDNVGAGDEILITAMEHHSNIVPWQILCEQVGAVLKVAPMNEAGELLLEDYRSLLGPRTRIVAVTHLSNALGTINPLRPMIDEAHAAGAAVLIDGAQSASHLKIDVQELDADFFVFSGHKVYGPTGIGVLYGKAEILEKMPPYQGGGEMINSVSFAKTTYNTIPFRFEAGTPNIAGAIGLGAAIKYVSALGMDRIIDYENALLAHATEVLSSFPAVRILGTADDKASVISFLVDNVHAHDIGTILDQEGIAIRTGHHCAEPVMEFFGVPATARASLSFYNTFDEIDRLARGIENVLKVFN